VLLVPSIPTSLIRGTGLGLFWNNQFSIKYFIGSSRTNPSPMPQMCLKKYYYSLYMKIGCFSSTCALIRVVGLHSGTRAQTKYLVVCEKWSVDILCVDHFQSTWRWKKFKEYYGHCSHHTIRSDHTRARLAFDVIYLQKYKKKQTTDATKHTNSIRFICKSQ